MCFRYARISGQNVITAFILASDIWVSDPKMAKIDVFLVYFRMIKPLVEYEDTSATERYFLKLLVVVKNTFCERMILWQESFDVKFDKNFNFGGYFWQKSSILV